jgi:DNA-directed RNA polymerase subunit M/transcription elongation factor TFIIS
VEDCLAVSLDALPDRSHPTWDLPFVIEIQWNVNGPMAGETTRLRMIVRRRQNQLIVELGKFGSPRLFLKQSVLIIPGGRRGRREYLNCRDCGAGVRKLFLPIMDMDAYLFRCRACHDLVYSSQFRKRTRLVCGPGRRHKSKVPKKTRGRPKEKRSYVRGEYDKAIVGLDEAYCPKCRLARRIAEPMRTTFRNDRPATTGACPVCGTRLWRARAGAN